MPNLFGLDIAGIVNSAIAGAGGVLSGTLIKTAPGTRTSGSLAGGTNPVETTHTFKGFIDKGSETRFAGQLQTVDGEVVSILGASLLNGVVPEVNDKITIEGAEYELVRLLRRDPGAALFEFEVEGG